MGLRIWAFSGLIEHQGDSRLSHEFFDLCG
jgi:hypothetical protein